MLHLNPTGSTQVHAVHFSVAPSDRRQFPAAISADEKFAGSAAVTRQERIRGFSTTRTRHLFVNSSIETEGGRKKRRVSVPSQHLKKMETCLTSYIPNFETLFLSRCLKKVFKGWNEVEAEVHDCCELYNNERIFKKFRFENCKSLKFFIVRSERYSVEGVTRDFKKGARYNNKRNIFLFDSSLAWLWLSCRCCFRLEVDAVADTVVSCRFNDGIEVPRVYEPRAFPLDFPLPPL